MTIDNRGLIQWTPTAAQINDPVSPYQVKIEVSDGEEIASATYYIDVLGQSNNAPPVITSDPKEGALANSVYAYEAAATDLDGEFVDLIFEYTISSESQSPTSPPTCLI
jgi:hypothetical protein